MSDAARKAQSDPSPAHKAGVLRQRMRRGDLDPARVRAAAACGHQLGLALFPDEAEAENEDIPHLLALLDRRPLWSFAYDCADRCLGVFESELPGDRRPRRAIEAARGLIFEELSPARAADAEDRLHDLWLSEERADTRSFEAVSAAVAVALGLINAARTSTRGDETHRIAALMSMAEDAAAFLVLPDGLHQAEFEFAREESRRAERSWQLQRLAVALLSETPL